MYVMTKRSCDKSLGKNVENIVFVQKTSKYAGEFNLDSNYF